MPVEQLIPRRTASPEAQLVQYDQYIDTQIRSTRRTVKLVDLTTAFVLLTSGVLAYLLAVALVEHWLVPGGFSVPARTLLFAALAGGSAYFAYKQIWPLCIRAINPVYAARAIEQSSPTLKNTLVNLLLFRQKRSEVSDAVYRTLEEQAAQRLTRVPIDAAVDRAQLIRFGYILIGVVAFAAVYKIASPKDPIVTAERVLLPWANIVPASRVQISAISPGDTTIARGEFMDVSAEVRGIGENDEVFLRFTTADGQAVRKAIPMKAAAGGLKFECRLPDRTDAAGFAGVGQNLTYRIEAGDARSLDFKVNVVTAPAILVEKIVYDYPRYTEFVDRTADGAGDIRAIEGTKVTIHARANSKIQEAFIDFDADGRRDLPLTFEGNNAKVSFTLSLKDDRQSPKFASYVLRFTNDEGRTNRDPVKYPIEVLRDYDPEVTLVAPQEKTVDVRLDQTVTIEIDARDPDFALSEVRLRGEAIGRPAINAPLLSEKHIGRFTAKYQFTPKDLQLRAGDIVHYWATASDNREVSPNTAATEKRTIRIVASDPNQPQQNRTNQNDPRRQQPGQNQQQEKQQPNNQAQNQNNDQSQSGGGGESAAADAQRGGADPGSKQTPGERMNSSQSKQDNPNQKNDAAENNGQSNPGNSAQAGDNSQSGGQPQANQSGQSGQGGDSQNKQSNQEQTGAGSAGGSASKNEGSQPSGARPDLQNGNGTQSSRSASQSGDNANSPPISSKGDNDAEAFRKMQEHLQQKGEIKKDELQNNSSQNGDQQNSSSQSSGQRGGESRRGQSQGGTPQNGKQPDRGAPQDGKQPGSSQQTGKPRNNTPQNGAKDASNAANDAQQPSGTEQKGGERNGNSANPNRGRSSETKQPGGNQNSDQSDASKNQNGEQNSKAGNSKDGAQELSGARGSNGVRRGGNEKQPGDTANDAGKQEEGQRGGTRSSRGPDTSNTDPNGKSTQPGQDERIRDMQSGKDADQKKWEQTPSSDSAGNKQNEGAPGRNDPNSNGSQGAELSDNKDTVTNKQVKRDGDGNSGSGKAADQGTGAAGEHGPGNDSTSAGRDVPSAEKTGQAGRDTAGKGSSQREGQGNDPGGKAGDSQSGKADPTNKSNDPTGTKGERGGNQTAAQSSASGDNAAVGSNEKNGDPGSAGKGSPGDKSNAARSQESGKSSAQSGQPGGNNASDKSADPTAEKSQQPGTPDGSGGQNGTNNATPQQADGESPGADAANLDYARKQTDMVLEKLSEQLNRKQVDKSLLQKLGWSEDDLRKFISRWNGRKEAASKPDASSEAARRELDDALMSLGLRPQTLRQSQVKDDTKHDANSGFRGGVPVEYQKRLQDYNRGVSRSRGNDGQK